MNEYKIELYRGADLQFFGTIPFLPVVKESLESLLGRSLLLESIQVFIHRVPEEPVAMEPPVVENLVPAFGYTYVRVYQGIFLIYRHPHPLYDVVTRTLQKKLSNQYPEENRWGFRVDVPGIPPLSSAELNPRLDPRFNPRQSILDSASQITRNIEIARHKTKTKPQFKIRRLEEKEPEVKTLADFGVVSEQANFGIQEVEEWRIQNNQNIQLDIQSDIQPESLDSTGQQEDVSKAAEEKIVASDVNQSNQARNNQPFNNQPVKIVLTRSLYQDLCHQRPLSRKVEEGGFLVGKVYRDGNEDDTYLLEVSNALTAQHTGASFLHLTFTGDSFVEVKRTLNQHHPEERLLGWYHTHLFPATPSFGLSSIDVELHFSTFTIPWQLAGLINLDNGNQRTLRFYARQGNNMVLCPYWVLDERD
ncbi:MAG: JAB N-terminal domain-containing protein [Cyanobacteria bacterium P01_A01_bin.80]